MAGVVNIVSLQLFLITNSPKKEIQPKHVQHKTCDTSVHSSLSGLQPTFFTLRLQMQCSSAKKRCENNKQIWKNLKCFTFQLKCLQMRSYFYKAGQYLIYAICKSDTSAASARRTSKSWSKLQTLKTAITTSEDTHTVHKCFWCLQVLCKPLEILTQNFMKNSKLNLFLLVNVKVK